jgi:hypothetical protein
VKIRTGFVSNSSTSSFCIWGAEFKPSELLEGTIFKAVLEEMRQANEYLAGLSDEDVVDQAGPHAFDGHMGTLEVHGNSDLGYYIGRSFKKIGDAETGSQFKENVQMQLDHYGIPATAGQCEEAWSDY